MAAIALVTTDMSTIEFDDPDLEPIHAALVAAGHDTVQANWLDESVDWSAFDLAVIRCPWDYMSRVEEFLAWLDRVETLTTLWNPPAFIRWNLDKTYLLTLDHLGVPVVPTLVAASVDEVGEAIAAVVDTGFDNLVVKPTVSAGSKDTGLFSADDPAAVKLAEHIVAMGKQVIVQPAIPSVAEVGEQALMFFNGEFSHAFNKGPLLAHGGGLLSGDEYVEQLSLATPTVDELDVAHRVLDAVRSVAPGLEGRFPLYARIDLVATDEGPLLLEAEMFEPSYNVWLADGLVERFVAAVESVLG
ncbi:MAG: hypothetical protein GX868_03445 [Actinobacteria bacterium]|nr:hypothetical protein [Actinomycetota bacterium]